MTISSGGVASHTMVHSGGSMVLSGGMVYEAELMSGAKVVWGNGYAEDTLVHSNGFLTTSETEVCGLLVASRGAAYISGGTVSGAEVERFGILQFCSGTEARAVVVHSGGHCYIGSGAVVGGELTIETGATVLAFTGSELNFTIEGRSAEDGALVSNLGGIIGNISYTITVAEDQAAGVYRLADSVGTFTKDVTLAFGDEVFEGFNVGETLESESGFCFELYLEDTSLLLEVSSGASPVALYSAGEDVLSGMENYTEGDGVLAASLGDYSGGESDILKNGILA